MQRESDVLVIGAGIIGCAVAHDLARRGLSVRVVERRVPAAGATQASAGMLAPFLEGHAGTGFLELAVRSLGLYDAFVERVREDAGHDVEYRRTGSLQVALDDRHAARLRADAEGRVESRWLTAGAALQAEPWLTATVQGGTLVETHGYVAVEALTHALGLGAARRGAILETGVGIASIDRAGDRLAARADDGREWRARSVVVAAGCWSGGLGREEPRVGGVRPVRGQTVRLRVEGTPIARIVWGPGCYVVPWTDGTVIVGATEEDAGFDQTVTASGVRGLLDAACALFPPLGAATFVEARVGLRPASPDGLPIVGRSARLPGLVYATGHFRNGVLLAPLTAALVGGLIAEGIDDPAFALTRPDRPALRERAGVAPA